MDSPSDEVSRQLRTRQPRGEVVDDDDEDDYAESGLSSSEEEEDDDDEQGQDDEDEECPSLPSSDGEEEEGESEQVHEDHGLKHVAEDDQTPRQIAKMLGLDPKVLVEINKHFVPGLTQTARLMEGTQLWLDEASAMSHVQHHGYACDECGVDPIVGARYSLKTGRRGEEEEEEDTAYDLCQSDFSQLPTTAQRKYEKHAWPQIEQQQPVEQSRGSRHTRSSKRPIKSSTSQRELRKAPQRSRKYVNYAEAVEEHDSDAESSEEPEAAWLHDGHRWLNERVARRVEEADGFVASSGTITKWSKCGSQLWFMWHDSGTEEELNNAEVRAAIALQTKIDQVAARMLNALSSPVMLPLHLSYSSYGQQQWLQVHDGVDPLMQLVEQLSAAELGAALEGALPGLEEQQDEEQQDELARLQAVRAALEVRTETAAAAASEEESEEEEEEESEEEEAVAVSASGTVDKVLGYRRSAETGKLEYLTKWKDQSHMHASWESAQSLKDLIGAARVRRFHAKNPYEQTEPYYPPEYATVERVISERSAGSDTQLLVKWCSMTYEECTWEQESDISAAEVEAFRARMQQPLRAAGSRNRQKAKFEQYEESAEYKGNRSLRDYQVEGLNWMVHNWRNGRSCILADEMGLGKTAQTVCALYELRQTQKVKGPFLIVVPLSTTSHWQREVHNWTGLEAVVFHGSANSREMIKQHEFRGTNKVGFDVLITTYEMVIAELTTLSKIEWEYLVVDEAHRLKNKNAMLYNYLTDRRLKWRHCHLLTGTPIQNNLDELHSLLHFIDAEAFEKDSTDFVRDHAVSSADDVSKLQGMLAPYLLRRLKEDVDTTIAAKEETIIWIELTSMQKKYYRAVLDQNVKVLCQSGRKSEMPSMRNVAIELRKLCIHPFLLKNVEEQEIASRQGLVPQQVLDDLLIHASGKFVLFDKLLPKLQRDGHRLLVFSQWTRVLDLLEDVLVYRQHKYERIDGNVTGLARQQAIDRFQAPGSDRFVFLLGTRAGGVGINLTAADTVVIFDSDWNPQNDLQAQARCHRIGQQKEVQIYRLVTSGTYEQKMFELSCKKLGLDQALLRSDVSQKGEGEPSKIEMEELLKFGAYDIMNDNGGESLDQDMDIDTILERKAEKRELGDGGVSSFSKAKFCAKVDTDDPNFWQKVMPEESFNRNEEVVDGPRQRKQAVRMNVADNGTGVKTYDEDTAGTLDDSDSDASIAEEEDTQLSWSKAELKRVLDATLGLGVGRWEDVRHQAVRPATRHTTQEVEAVGNLLVSIIQDLGQQLNWIVETNEEEGTSVYISPEGMKFHDESDAVDAGWCAAWKLCPSEVDDFVRNEDFVAKIKRNCARWGPLIQHADSLAKLMQSSTKPEAEAEAEAAVTVAQQNMELVQGFKHSKSCPNLDWWTYTHDESLLRGAYVHGLRQFDRMLTDSTLGFQEARAAEAATEAAAEAAAEAATDAAADAATDAATGEAADAADAATGQATQQQISSAALGGSSSETQIVCRQLKGALDLGTMIIQLQDGTSMRPSEFELRAGCTDQQWKLSLRVIETGETLDNFLASRGVIKAGDGCATVTELFKNPYTKLKARLDQLLMHVGVIVSKKPKAKKTAQPTVDTRTTWLKRDNHAVFKALMAHGHHSCVHMAHATDADVTKLSQIAKLDQFKEPKMLHTKILQLLSIALTMQKNEDPKFLCGSESTQVIQLSSLEDACKEQGHDYTEMKKVADGEAAEHCGWRLTDQLLTVSQAKHLTDRIQLFGWLRTTAVSHQLLARFCRKLPSKHSSMPGWWKRGEHDIELVKLVAEHGLDSQFWTREPFAAHVVGTSDDSADFQESTPKDHFVWNRLLRLRKSLPKKTSFVPLPMAPSESRTNGGVKVSSDKKKSTKQAQVASKGTGVKVGGSVIKRSNPWQKMTTKAAQPVDVDSDDDDFRKPAAKKSKLPVQPIEGLDSKIVAASASPTDKRKDEIKHDVAPSSADQTAAAVVVLEGMSADDKAAALAAMPYDERAAAVAAMQCDEQKNTQSPTTGKTNTADMKPAPAAKSLAVPAAKGKSLAAPAAKAESLPAPAAKAESLPAPAAKDESLPAPIPAPKGEQLSSRELIKRAQMQRVLAKRSHSDVQQSEDPVAASSAVPLQKEAAVAEGTPHGNSSGLSNKSNIKLLLAKSKAAAAAAVIAKSGEPVKRRKLKDTRPPLTGMRSLTTFFNKVISK